MQKCALHLVHRYLWSRRQEWPQALCPCRWEHFSKWPNANQQKHQQGLTSLQSWAALTRSTNKKHIFYLKLCRAGLGLGSGFILRAWAFVGLVWPGLRARGLDCSLSPKTRPMQTRVFGLCSKSPSLSRPYLKPSKAYQIVTIIPATQFFTGKQKLTIYAHWPHLKKITYFVNSQQLF
jgi:hypothetical protein